MASERVVVVGAGFSGLASACCLAKKGYSVRVVEKHEQTGGRARTWEKDGFRFDMGPSWYWMPEVFEEFFNLFGKSVSDYYTLKRLDPPYRVFFEGDQVIDLPDSVDDLASMFEEYESGAGGKLRQFMKQAAYKYRVGMSDYVRRPCVSIFEFLNPFDVPRLLVEVFRLQMLQSQRSHVRGHFSNRTLVKLMEWPVLFLGGAPDKVPAMYSMMNHACIVGGTHYPERAGMRAIVDAMEALARELGVEFSLGDEVVAIDVDPTKGGGGAPAATSVSTASGAKHAADVVVISADYHHMEQNVLPKQYRRYDESYWQSRVMSPGSLLFYLGVSKRVGGLEHHNLFFDEELDPHARDIYETPRWPDRPLFYVCCPSVTDETVAPEGCENIFILIPLAPGLEDTEELREKYFDMVMKRLEHRTGESIREHIVLKRSYAHNDFEQDYYAFKGNAYGLANTLSQTAILKPSLASNVSNLWYTGQLTTPGPGVPPSLISGQIVADLIDEAKAVRTGKARATIIPSAVVAVAVVAILCMIVFTSMGA